MQHMHQPITKWYDPLQIITWLYWFTDLDLTCFSPMPWSIGPKSCSSFTVAGGPSLQSLQLVIHTYNRSIEPSLILIFSTLITWFHVMFHIQSAPPPSHIHESCVSHINTISLPKLSLNYENQTRTFTMVRWQKWLETARQRTFQLCCCQHKCIHPPLWPFCNPN